VCVFPEDVCPYANTVPLNPPTTESMIPFVVFAYTSFVVDVSSKTLSSAYPVPSVVAADEPGCATRGGREGGREGREGGGQSGFESQLSRAAFIPPGAERGTNDETNLRGDDVARVVDIPRRAL
jgi:hypothetical protein